MRLDELGVGGLQLGAGVAHELNNPLTGILGYSQLLLDSAPGAAADREVLAMIEAAARRCRDITHNLLRFSEQRAEPSLQDLDASRVVRDALDLAGGQLAHAGVALEVDLPDPGPRVRADPGQLAQVVFNLLANARTACEGRTGAGVKVSVGGAGGEVTVRVEDQGKGIRPEHLPRIFEPFFTTKERWGDVGLGLSVSWRIVAEHGGRIDVESRVGEGSAFTVRLPVTAPAR